MLFFVRFDVTQPANVTNEDLDRDLDARGGGRDRRDGRRRRAAPVEGRRPARRARRRRPADGRGPRPRARRAADHPRDGARREDRGAGRSTSTASSRTTSARAPTEADPRPTWACRSRYDVRPDPRPRLSRRRSGGGGRSCAPRRAAWRPGGACATRASASSGGAGAGPPARGRSAPASRSSASARLRDWLRASCATARTTGPQRAVMRAFCASSSVAEAATSKLASIREAVTLACWPPGPEERLARTTISSSGIERWRLIGSRSGIGAAIESPSMSSQPRSEPHAHGRRASRRDRGQARRRRVQLRPARQRQPARRGDAQEQGRRPRRPRRDHAAQRPVLPGRLLRRAARRRRRRADERAAQGARGRLLPVATPARSCCSPGTASWRPPRQGAKEAGDVEVVAGQAGRDRGADLRPRARRGRRRASPATTPR